jgi:hypothetical protein
MSPEKPRMVEAGVNSLARAINEYKIQPHTPELVSETWQTVWQAWGKRINQQFAVPSLDLSQKELRTIEKQGKMMVYIPEELAGHANIYSLGDIFSNIKMYGWCSGLHDRQRIINEHSKGGWYDIEASSISPHKGITEKEEQALFKQQGRTGQRLNTYIIGSHFSREVTGNYFDSARYSVSRLHGSRDTRYGNAIVYANFLPYGYLYVSAAWFGERHYPYAGVRSENAKSL